jgi:SAM-dependent methyltransferase
MKTEIRESVIRDHTEVFQNTLPLQVCLEEVGRIIGSTEDLACLEIGTENGVFSRQLRRLGGTWQSVAASTTLATSIGAVLEEDVQVIDGSKLPFKKKLFDIVVVINFLERFEDDIAFIEECHKVLKPGGRLVVTTVRLGHWAPARGIRRLLGLTHENRGLARSGYTEPELFRVLKSGFDVHAVRPYSRFFVEATEAVLERLTEANDPESTAADKGRRRRYRVAGFCYSIASQLDFLLLMSKGYRQIAIAKRRGWRPRTAPILIDGRSITEAVLSRPGG